MTRAEEVKEVIIDTLSFDGQITDDADLVKDLKIDSLDIVELMMALEEKYDVKIPDEDIENLHTVKQVATWLDAHLDK